MRGWVFLGLMVLVLPSCGSDRSTAESNVRSASRDGDRVQFGTTWMGSTGKTPVLCGYANFPNAFGGMTGTKGFVASTGPGGPVLIQGDVPEVAGLDPYQTAYDGWCSATKP